ncbi:hypothetical protein L218DRAFT_952262 [Marasmius fiardii PR-910]|nr:hypothetical protein L218DRAFT_952262 [Marasmius fiardii PR-910]
MGSITDPLAARSYNYRGLHMMNIVSVWGSPTIAISLFRFRSGTSPNGDRVEEKFAGKCTMHMFKGSNNDDRSPGG